MGGVRKLSDKPLLTQAMARVRLEMTSSRQPVTSAVIIAAFPNPGPSFPSHRIPPYRGPSPKPPTVITSRAVALTRC
jgi:hypothetical protein